MNTLRMLLQSLLLMSLCGFVVAQTDSAQSDNTLPDMVTKLDRDIAALRALNGQIDGAEEMDQDALVFRRDKRSFGLLVHLDKLVRQAAQLPEGDPQRAVVEDRLAKDLMDVGGLVLTRSGEIGARIATQAAQRDSLSGGQKIAAEAYINSLETMRYQYYGALVDVLEGRQLLGLASQGLDKGLEQQLFLHAEAVVGRTEFSTSAMKEVGNRLEHDPANADLAAVSATLAIQRQLYLQRLNRLVALMDRLEIDSSSYKSVLVKQADSLSLQALQSGVLMELLGDAWVFLRESIVASAPEFIFQFLVFVIIVLIFRTISRLTKRAVLAACERPSVDMSELLKNVLVSISGGTVMTIGILMALSQVGISLGPMLAGLGVAGFVVGFALQDTLGNFAAGAMILIYRPYDVDDFVEVTGASGLVKKMSLVSTTITTFDNQTLVVPNSKIWGDVIKNVTAQKVRRVDLVFGIGYSDDIEHTERVLEDILANHEKVLSKPESMIKLHALADSSVNFVVRPWVRTEDYWDVYFDITREVKMRFDREGISIPFPQRDVHLHKDQGQA